MTLHMLAAGPQTTIQGAPRIGLRHHGVPLGGPADPLSMALANRLVGQPPWASALEIALGPARLRFAAATAFAVTGAQARLRLDGGVVPWHRTLQASAGSVLEIGPCQAGARLYLALAATLAADVFMDSTSTYLPAALGGHRGRALRAGDELGWTGGHRDMPQRETPLPLRPPLARRWTLRVVPGPDWPAGALLPDLVCLRVGARMDRMGLALAGAGLPEVAQSAARSSEALFPGALQRTPDGQGFLLLADGQTTGGYPHLMQVIRADRHLAGQLRQGDDVRLRPVDQATAQAALAHKQSLMAAWLPGLRLP